jgi:hypothetical protein
MSIENRPVPQAPSDAGAKFVGGAVVGGAAGVAAHVQFML